MTEILLPVDGAWAIGLMLTIMRVAGFVLAFPLLATSLPATARLTFALAVGWGLSEPLMLDVSATGLIASGLLNVTIGAALGWLSGVALQVFASAGGILDLISGLAVSQIFDPLTGDQGGVYQRMFHLVGMTLFVTIGGLGLVAAGLDASLEAIPLDAGLSPAMGLSGYALELMADMIRHAVELALPVMGVMLMLELGFGLAARFAPQANVFLLGLPAKLLASLTIVGGVWVLFPDVMDRIETSFPEVISTGLRGLGAG